MGRSAESRCHARLSPPDQGPHFVSPSPAPSPGPRIVICDCNLLLLSVTGLLRMSDYVVFQAYDATAAKEPCCVLPDVSLLILPTLAESFTADELLEAVGALMPAGTH